MCTHKLFSAAHHCTYPPHPLLAPSSPPPDPHPHPLLLSGCHRQEDESPLEARGDESAEELAKEAATGEEEEEEEEEEEKFKFEKGIFIKTQVCGGVGY